MKTITQISRMMFAALSLMLLLVGCGGGGGPAGFATDQVAGKTFAYVGANASVASGALAFNADGTWRSAPYSGTWTIDANGKLVCVTTAGGNHTITYTLLDSTAGDLKVSAVELNPADPTKPTSYTATFAVALTADMIAGQKLLYSSVSGSTTSTGVIEFSHDGSWRTTTDTATYIGSWSIVDGKLVCVTTTGGNHTITYTRLSATTNPMSTSASEVNPADPTKPVISAVTLNVVLGATPASASQIFNFNLTFKNLPASLPQTASTTPNYTVIPYRRYWVFFVPTFLSPIVPFWKLADSARYIMDNSNSGYHPDPSNPSSEWGVNLYPNGIPAGTPVAGLFPAGAGILAAGYYSNPVAGTTASFGFIYGTTAVIATTDNYFYFKVSYPTADGNTLEFTTPLMGFPIWSTPANSSWVYDHANNSMTRTN